MKVTVHVKNERDNRGRAGLKAGGGVAAGQQYG